MAAPKLLGDLRERADGSFGGWCWAPDRPTERLIIDLLVNDTPSASIVAASFRRDLLTRGIGDGRHGFTLRLPANLPEAGGEYFLTARERRSGMVFGRVLRTPPGGAPSGDSEQVSNLAASVEELWRGLAAARALHADDLPSARLRAALGMLAGQLAPRGLPRAPPIVLPDVTEPALSIVLPVDSAAAALRRIAALAPALGLIGAEIVAIDAGSDAAAAMLPTRVRNLRYRMAAGADTPTAALAVAEARGSRLLLLDAPPPEPSAAALIALARADAGLPPGLLLGPVAAAALTRNGAPAATLCALPGRLGLALCIDRDVLVTLGPLDPALRDGAGLEYADLAFRARLLGIPVHAVAEPQAVDRLVAPAAAPEPAQIRQALAAFAARWGGVA